MFRKVWISNGMPFSKSYLMTMKEVFLQLFGLNLLSSKKSVKNSTSWALYAALLLWSVEVFKPVALNPEHPCRWVGKVFQDSVQQYQNNLQAGFPLWHSNPTEEWESGLHVRRKWRSVGRSFLFLIKRHRSEKWICQARGCPQTTSCRGFRESGTNKKSRIHS